jgi:hypothetical protein
MHSKNNQKVLLWLIDVKLCEICQGQFYSLVRYMWELYFRKVSLPDFIMNEVGDSTLKFEFLFLNCIYHIRTH